MAKKKQYMQIHINGKDYPKLYKTEISLTNTGEEALSGGDVSTIGHDPIRIIIPPRVRILHYGLDNEETSKDVSVELIPIEGAIIIKFNYLNPNNKITVDLYSEDSYSGYEIQGSAVNVNQITQAWTDEQTQKFILSIVCSGFPEPARRTGSRRIPYTCRSCRSG